MCVCMYVCMCMHVCVYVCIYSHRSSFAMAIKGTSWNETFMFTGKEHVLKENSTYEVMCMNKQS